MPCTAPSPSCNLSQSMEIVLRSDVKRCKIEYIEQVALEAKTEERHGSMLGVWRAIKPLLPNSKIRQQRKTLPAASILDHALAHFSHEEKGELTTAEQIFDENQAPTAQLGGAGMSVKLEDIPTLAQYEAAFAKLSKGKSPGEDLLVGELFSKTADIPACP